jgi:hypothetical protein
LERFVIRGGIRFPSTLVYNAIAFTKSEMT